MHPAYSISSSQHSLALATVCCSFLVLVSCRLTAFLALLVWDFQLQ